MSLLSLRLFFFFFLFCSPPAFNQMLDKPRLAAAGFDMLSFVKACGMCAVTLGSLLRSVSLDDGVTVQVKPQWWTVCYTKSAFEKKMEEDPPKRQKAVQKEVSPGTFETVHEVCEGLEGYWQVHFTFEYGTHREKVLDRGLHTFVSNQQLYVMQSPCFSTCKDNDNWLTFRRKIDT